MLYAPFQCDGPIDESRPEGGLFYEKCLFSVGLQCTADLDKHKMSAELREQFRTHDKALAKRARWQ